MTQSPEAKAKAARFPAELQPQPDYRYELPEVEIVNGERCVWVDAGLFAHMQALANTSTRKK